MKHPRLSLLLTAGASLALSFGFLPNASAATQAAVPSATSSKAVGAVFVQTNDLKHNSVMAYDRAANGKLTWTGTYATGGTGAILGGAEVDPLASQGSLTLDAKHKLLFAVNGGSDTVTVFSVDGSRLIRRQILSSHGDVPVSVSVRGNLVYVLNARKGGSVSGYEIKNGKVVEISKSTRKLNMPDNGQPEFVQTAAQAIITPNGKQLVISTKTHGNLLTFQLDSKHRPAKTPVKTKSGAVPFALTFDKNSKLQVIDASGMATSYTVRSNGTLAKISQVGPTGEQLTCWSVYVKGTLYAANAGTNSISTFTTWPSGKLNLANAKAATTGAGPVDVAASSDGKYIYQLAGGSGEITTFQRHWDGSLTKISDKETGLGHAAGRPFEGIAAS